MTKKHFIAIAALIKKHRLCESKTTFVIDMMDMLADDNERFDHQRFAAACKCNNV